MKIEEQCQDNILDLLQELEPLLIDYVRSNPLNKEDAKLVLGNLRKALAGDYSRMKATKKKVKKAWSFEW